MKMLRNPTKCDLLLSIFEDIGDSMSVQEVIQVTGIKNYNTLKALCSYIRHTKNKIPEENRIDIRIKNDLCIRVN